MQKRFIDILPKITNWETIKYCKLGEIPENIKDDWKETIIQYIDFLDHHVELEAKLDAYWNEGKEKEL